MLVHHRLHSDPKLIPAYDKIPEINPIAFLCLLQIPALYHAPRAKGAFAQTVNRTKMFGNYIVDTTDTI